MKLKTGKDRNMFNLISGTEIDLSGMETGGFSENRRLNHPFLFFLLTNLEPDAGADGNSGSTKSPGTSPGEADADYIIAECAPDFFIYTAQKKSEIPFSYTHPPLHRHSFYELLFVLEGELYQIIEGIRHYYPAGSACILNPNVRHTEEFSTSFRAVYFQLSREFLKDCFEAPAYFACDSTSGGTEAFLPGGRGEKAEDYKEYIDFIPRPDYPGAPEEIHRLIDKMLRETLSPSPGASSEIRADTVRLFLLLYDESRLSRMPIRLDTDREAKLFGDIRALMSETRGMISRTELASKLHYSGNYIYRTVRKYTGMNIVDYAISFRLEEAAALLDSTSRTAEDIALSTGFRNKTHFYRVFRASYGMTPKQYRSRSDK